MASGVVSAAFEAQLATWSNITACPLVDANMVAATPTEPPFIEMEYPFATDERESIGDNALFREEGGVRFVITVKAFAPGWKAQVRTWVEEIRDLFIAWEFASGDGEVLSVSPPVFDDANRDGNRYRVPFVAIYQYDRIR